MIDKEKFALNGKFTSSAGKTLEKYYDFIQAFFDEDFLCYIEDCFIELTPCNLIGIELFGALLTSYLTGIIKESVFNPLFILKKREHGARKELYNRVKPKWKTYLIDDVITSTKTLKYALDILEQNKIWPDKIICIKNRSAFTKLRGIKIIEI